MMSHAEIRNWLNERGINVYSGSIGVEDVIRVLEAFQKLWNPFTVLNQESIASNSGQIWPGLK